MKSLKPLSVSVLVFIIIIICSCNLKPSKDNRIGIETYEKYIQKGNEISNLAQSVLLANVGKAIQKGGIEYAVEFCNLEASVIIDSLNILNNAKISRVSIKNRNSENNLNDETEEQLWNAVAKDIQTGSTKDTVIRLKDKFVYYKPIKTAMQTCLKCHGNPDTDIEPATLIKIQTLYPYDLATGYQLNDFRGLWKIEFIE